MGSVDWNAAMFWLMAVQGVGTVALGIYAWLLRRRQATKDEIAGVEERTGTKLEQLEGRIDTHAERLTEGDKRFERFEQHLAALPGTESINALSLQLSNLNGDLRVTNASLAGLTALHEVLNRQVGVIDQFLRDHQ